ncbi:MAG: FAD-dependent oxidoreductase, partial [Roseiarcus sp.]
MAFAFPTGVDRRVGWLIAALVAALIAGLALSGAADPHRVAASLVAAKGWAGAHLIGSALAYAALYVVFAALSLPGAWTMSVAGGALFGPWIGVPLVSLSSTLGATVAMLLARYVFRDAVEARFPDFVARVNRGVARDGARYLFAARLTPLVPFFAINLGVGLTRMRVTTFVAVTLVGALPIVVLYVAAGQQFASIRAPQDILSARIVVALIALAAAPFAAKGLGVWRDSRAALAAWPRPRRFDYNLIVVGAGSAGLVAAYVAAAARARVLLIEQGAMGGDCLNTGCVPSKALIRSAKLAHEGRRPEAFGLTGRLDPDFSAVMARVRSVVDKVAPHDSAERYRGLGAEVISGRARLLDPWTVEVDGRRVTGRRIVVATGAEPVLPPIPGLADVAPLTSETLWTVSERPARLLVVGGGAIGCELAQSFARLGSATTLVEGAPRLIPREDEDASAAMRTLLQADGVAVVEGVGVASFARGQNGSVAFLADGRQIAFDRVVVAVGRRPRTSGFGLEALGLLDDNGRLVVDERLRTRVPTIYAAGDVLGQLQFTHAAGQYGVYAATHALLGPFRPGKARLPAFPMAIYTDPEIARVGLNETEARERGVRYETTRYDLAELDRAIADGADSGFVKVLTRPGKDRILGVTIMGARAGEMLGEFT